jgi:hypothetical protein
VARGSTAASACRSTKAELALSRLAWDGPTRAPPGGSLEGGPRMLRFPDACPECHRPADLPVIQPLYQHRIWQQLAPGDGHDRLADVIERLRHEDSRFHVEGGSWTSDLSWVRGYDQVLIPMEQASALFHEQILARGPFRRPAAPQGPCSTCWPLRPAATATGTRASGLTTAPNWPVAPPRSSRILRPDGVSSASGNSSNRRVFGRQGSLRAYPARQAASTRKRGGTGPGSSATDG